ncbi:unnamed protein product [Ectocarpus sp. 6 AP-2014]
MREAAGLLSANLGEAMDRTGKHTTDPFVQEAFFRHIDRIFPEHPVALRSLGYKFEESGQELRAMELYREGLARNPERLDLRLLLASSCSPFLDDAPHQGDMRQVEREGEGGFLRVSAEIRRLVEHIQAPDTPLRNVPNPGQDLRHIPNFSWQYLGRNMRPLMESLCWILAAMAVGLHEAIARLQPRNAWDNSTSSGRQGTRGAFGEGEQPQTSLTPPPSIATRDVRITVGFVVERWGNRSPHRLIQGVLAWTAPGFGSWWSRETTRVTTAKPGRLCWKLPSRLRSSRGNRLRKASQTLSLIGESSRRSRRMSYATLPWETRCGAACWR